MVLTLKELLWYLNFDEETWNKDKAMLGYIPGEKYEDFFYRKHGFKHTDQSWESSTVAISTIDRIISVESEITALTKNVKRLVAIIKVMDELLTVKVKGYTSVLSSLPL